MASWWSSMGLRVTQLTARKSLFSTFEMAGSVCAAISGGHRRNRGSVSTAAVTPCLPLCDFIEPDRAVMTWWVRASLAFFPEPNVFTSTPEPVAHSDSSSVALLLALDIFEEDRWELRLSVSPTPNSGPNAVWAPLMSCGSCVNWCRIAFCWAGVRWLLDSSSETGSWPRDVITRQPLSSAPASSAIRRRVAMSPDSVALSR
mmetsp:Transcript_6599/g.17705  ORF Transcript_6599/g.17705 Transcript_6599/m.17705 type:complete len:202 (-) Transcript_6599:80-685(-)